MWVLTLSGGYYTGIMGKDKLSAKKRSFITAHLFFLPLYLFLLQRFWFWTSLRRWLLGLVVLKHLFKLWWAVDLGWSPPAIIFITLIIIPTIHRLIIITITLMSLGSRMFSSGSQVLYFGLQPFHLTKYWERQSHLMSLFTENSFTSFLPPFSLFFVSLWKNVNDLDFFSYSYSSLSLPSWSSSSTSSSSSLSLQPRQQRPFLQGFSAPSSGSFPPEGALVSWNYNNYNITEITMLASW